MVLSLNSKVNFGLCQVLDHELRLFRELEVIKSQQSARHISHANSKHVLKALRFIDRKRRDGLDKKQLLVFLNSNVADSQLKMADVTTIFWRLRLKQSGCTNYIDFFNAVYCWVEQEGEGGSAVTKSQNLTKKFINLIDAE